MKTDILWSRYYIMREAFNPVCLLYGRSLIVCLTWGYKSPDSAAALYDSSRPEIALLFNCLDVLILDKFKPRPHQTDGTEGGWGVVSRP